LQSSQVRLQDLTITELKKKKKKEIFKSVY